MCGEGAGGVIFEIRVVHYLCVCLRSCSASRGSIASNGKITSYEPSRIPCRPFIFHRRGGTQIMPTRLDASAKTDFWSAATA